MTDYLLGLLLVLAIGAASSAARRRVRRAEVMERLAPLGPVYHAGTLSGNPVAMAPGLATLRAADEAAYAALDANAD